MMGSAGCYYVIRRKKTTPRSVRIWLCSTAAGSSPKLHARREKDDDNRKLGNGEAGGLRKGKMKNDGGYDF
jgi:hypothetical protein